MGPVWLTEIGYWHWLVLGVACLILDVFSPGVFFLWIGIAAGLVGLLLLAFPALTWEWQLLLFAFLSLVSIFSGWHYLRRYPGVTDQPNLNRRAERYLGRVFTLDAPIVDGVGKVRVDDTFWKVSGADCPGQTRVRVTGVDGVVLMVECLEQAPR
jgi:membrane protein implicated in regulation of membrane protease activity